MTRVLLIGGSGRLGTAIRHRWTRCDLRAPRHGELAIEDGARLRDAVAAFAPDVIVNAAGFSDVDRAQANVRCAFEINALAVGAAASLARDRGAAFVTISSDYVFDGATDSPYTERDAPHPLGVYGASKLAGEHLAQCLGERNFVVRTCGLYGASSGAARASFVDRVVAQERVDAPLRVVADVVASPTFAGDLADALWSLLRSESYGLYHAVNDGTVSWYDVAVEVVRQTGGRTRIEPIAAAQRPAPAPRPRFSALATGKLAALGITMPPWRAGIAAYLDRSVK